jgi:hypothetical protein
VSHHPATGVIPVPGDDAFAPGVHSTDDVQDKPCRSRPVASDSVFALGSVSLAIDSLPPPARQVAKWCIQQKLCPGPRAQGTKERRAFFEAFALAAQKSYAHLSEGRALRPSRLPSSSESGMTSSTAQIISFL